MSPRRLGQNTHEWGQFLFSKGPRVRRIRWMPSKRAQALLPARGTVPRLGERLVAARLISEGQLQRALDLQAQTSRPLGTVLVELGVLDEDRLTAMLGEHLEIPVADLRIEAVDSE